MFYFHISKTNMDSKKDQDKTIDYTLRPFQQNIVEECWNKESGGLSLPMGSGKTRIALMLSDSLSGLNESKITLVVCSKSEITTWIEEMIKCGYEKHHYEVLHKEYIKNLTTWSPAPQTKVIITNINTLSKVYTKHNLKTRIVKNVCPYFGAPNVKYFYPTEECLLHSEEGSEWLFSHVLGTLIVDEAQTYLNIRTMGGQALLCIMAKQKWLLSGTLFDEPVPKRILGYLCLLRIPNTPRSVVDTGDYIRGTPLKYNYTNIRITPFSGLKSTMVYRLKNLMYKEPKINTYIVKNTMTTNERRIYTALRSVFIELSKKEALLKAAGENIEARRCRTAKLAMLTYLRMSLISPLIPITGVYIDIMDFKVKSDLSRTLIDEFNKLRLTKWLDDEKAAYTTRIKCVRDEIKKYDKEKIVLFTCFRKSLDMIKYYLDIKKDGYGGKSKLSNKLVNEIVDISEINRDVFTITGKMKIEERTRVIDAFRKSNNGVLLLTYATGGNGLNLQCSNTVFITEFWWNAGKSDQGIARVNRFGQKSSVVNIVYFTSNTAIEKAIFHKHKDKQIVFRDLLYGTQKNKITTISFKEILQFVEMEENEDLLRDIHLDGKHKAK